MNRGVPKNWPAAVCSPRALSSRAIPKSISFVSPFRRRHDVGRLDVAVHDLAAMRVVEGLGHASHQPERLPPVERQLDLGERHAFEALECNVEQAARRIASGVVDGDDAGMGEMRRDAGLAEEALLELVPGVLREGEPQVDRLERDRAVERGVVGFEDDTHAPLAKLSANLVTADPSWSYAIQPIASASVRGGRLLARTFAVRRDVMRRSRCKSSALSSGPGRCQGPAGSPRG